MQNIDIEEFHTKRGGTRCTSLRPNLLLSSCEARRRIVPGTPGANYFEPLFFEVLTHFTKLMEAYQAAGEEKSEDK